MAKTTKKKAVSKRATDDGPGKPPAKEVATKKKVAKKAASKKGRVSKKKVAKKAVAARRSISAAERHQLIAEAAYLRSEAQGFLGDAREDWLIAEQEIDAHLRKTKLRVSG